MYALLQTYIQTVHIRTYIHTYKQGLPAYMYANILTNIHTVHTDIPTDNHTFRGYMNVWMQMYTNTYLENIHNIHNLTSQPLLVHCFVAGSKMRQPISPIRIWYARDPEYSHIEPL